MVMYFLSLISFFFIEFSSIHMLSFFCIFLLTLSVFFFVSTFYYVFTLLVLSLLSLVLLCSYGSVSPLVAILLFVVYVGAMIVLIGYICAVCPNVLFKSSLHPLALPSCLLLALSFVPSFFTFPSGESTHLSVLTSLYSASGLYLFITLVLILFFVLLIVTTQHLLPNGPFRSVS